MIDSKKIELLIDEIKAELITADENDKSSLCLQISSFYRKLVQYKEALEYAELIKEYATNKDSYIKGVWMVGLINKNMDDKEEALKNYDICLEHYKSNNKKLNLGDMLKNKSRLLNCPSLAIQAIETFKNTDEATIKDIDDAYDSLVDIYISIEDYTNALEAVNNIQNIELRLEVANRVRKHFII